MNVVGSKPGRKTASAEELEERVDAVAKLLAARRTKGDVKRLGMQKWDVSARTMEDYISRAREKLVTSTQKTALQHHNEALLFYESILQQADASPSDRMRAQDSICRLLGLDAAQKHEHSGKLAVDLGKYTDEQLGQLEAILGSAQP